MAFCVTRGVVGCVARRDYELVVEVVWVLVYLTSMSDTNSEVLVNTGLLPPLVTRLATSDQLTILTPVRYSVTTVRWTRVSRLAYSILYYDDVGSRPSQ